MSLQNEVVCLSSFGFLFTLFCVPFPSDLELKPVGMLEVKLVQAKNLTNKDIVGKSDPFAKMFIRPLREKTQRSKTIVSSSFDSFFFFGA